MNNLGDEAPKLVKLKNMEPKESNSDTGLEMYMSCKELQINKMSLHKKMKISTNPSLL
jgi:hypothetical protein